IDSRLRHADFENHAAATGNARWLGMPIEALSGLQRVLVVGSNLRKDHPLFAQRIRQAARKGGVVHLLNDNSADWAMPVAQRVVNDSRLWVSELAGIAAAVAAEAGVQAPVAVEEVRDEARAIARSLLSGERKALLLGNAAAHHEKATSLLSLANWIAQHTGATVGYLSEAANTVGAQLVNAVPGRGGLNASQMLGGAIKAVLLLNTEPSRDTAATSSGLKSADMVVTMSPFKTNLDVSDVLLPIAPFTETSGSFVNAEGRLQSFHAVVKPLGETRPAWKVLRVLGNLMGLSGFDADSSQAVLAKVLPGVASGAFVDASRLDNSGSVVPDLAPAARVPCVASIYQLDGLVRRAPALQSTSDGRDGKVSQGEVAA
ncbi:MAG: NADH-quinone oxidoreductase subunit G, partial [Comamonadaceae bacterium]|nr:NADH-quinone oxidoreductase subunit G [Comamonadaceae bacterium]